MLTARRPFGSDGEPQQVLEKIVNASVPPMHRPELPPGLEEFWDAERPWEA